MSHPIQSRRAPRQCRLPASRIAISTTSLSCCRSRAPDHVQAPLWTSPLGGRIDHSTQALRASSAFGLRTRHFLSAGANDQSWQPPALGLTVLFEGGVRQPNVCPATEERLNHGPGLWQPAAVAATGTGRRLGGRRVRRLRCSGVAHGAGRGAGHGAGDDRRGGAAAR
jgi:hypothetical protein